MSAEEAKQKEEKPKTAREVAFDGMCSTIRQAYREWERQQKGRSEGVKQWSTRELRYLEEHAGDGAKQVAKDLGRSIDSVKHMARKCGLSLRKRRQCPRCGQWTFRPLNRVNGWCIECTKELHMADLAEQANAMKEEAIREKRNDRQRQRYYSQKSRAKKATKKRP